MTASNDEDDGGAPGWSIGDDSYSESGGAWSTFTNNIMPQVSEIQEPNVEATGVPVVEGTPQVGEVLSAYTHRIVDENGKPDDRQGFRYRWQGSHDGSSNWTDIPGATAPNYFPTDADVGTHVRVQVRITDDDGYYEGPLNSAGRATPTAVFFATMTVDKTTNGNLGIGPSVDYPDASITPTSFTYRGVTRLVTLLDFVPANEEVRLELSEGLSETDRTDLVLALDDQRLALADAAGSNLEISKGFKTFTWSGVTVDWSDGETVAVIIESLELDPTADVTIKASETLSLPWSATVTGEHDSVSDTTDTPLPPLGASQKTRSPWKASSTRSRALLTAPAASASSSTPIYPWNLPWLPEQRTNAGQRTQPSSMRQMAQTMNGAVVGSAGPTATGSAWPSSSPGTLTPPALPSPAPTRRARR